jgi:hypothetical protein
LTPEGFYSFQIRAFQGAAPMIIIALQIISLPKVIPEISYFGTRQAEVKPDFDLSRNNILIEL